MLSVRGSVEAEISGPVLFGCADPSAGPVLYNLYRGLLPLQFHESPLVHVNDIVFHQTLTQRILETGQHDAWVPQWGSGAAVLRYYQNFSHLAAAFLAKLSGMTSLSAVVVVNALFFGAYPAVIYWSARKTGLEEWAAAFASLASMIVGCDTGQKHLFGLQSWSFTWEGWGLYTQIVAAVWGFLAWGQAAQYIVRGDGFLRASVYLALSWLSHLIVGYGMSAVTVVLVLGAWRATGGMSPARAMGYAFVRWLALNLAAAFLISYLILPTLVEAHILNRSRFEPPEYWDSYGAATAFRWLFKGALLDRVYGDGAWNWLFGNTPVFTLTVLAGAATIVGTALRMALFSKSRRLDEGSRSALLVLGAFVVSFTLFTGRSTFGPAVLRLVPFSVNLPFHRFFVHFHMFAILIAGWMLHRVCLLIVWVCSRRASLASLGYVVAAVFVVGLVVLPMGMHLRQKTVGHQRDLEAQNQDVEEWWGNATYTLMKRVADVVHERPGRAYAGGGWNWGKHFTLKFAKVYSLWQQRGLWVPNISYMWHAMGLNSEMDNHFDESRHDHLRLYNVRYVLCKPDTPTQPAVQMGDVRGGHAVFEWPAAQGYFSFMQLIGCISAYSLPKDSFWLWREQFVMSRNLHTVGKHYRTALLPREACSSDSERVDAALPQGEVVDQRGNTDDFQTTLDCREDKGCSVLLRVTYHPLFVCRSAKTGAILPTFAVAPSYIGFVAPRGLDTYNVRWEPPLWSNLLFLVCYGSMALFLAASFCSRARPLLSPGLFRDSSPLSSPAVAAMPPQRPKTD